MSVTLSKVKLPDFEAQTGHWHIGSNMPGYLPENEVTCMGSITDAAYVLADDLSCIQSLMEDMCTAETEDQKDQGSDCCAWCSAYYDIESVLVGIRAVERDVLHSIHRDGGYSYTHNEPECSRVVRYWITKHEDNRDDCLLYRDQENAS